MLELTDQNAEMAVLASMVQSPRILPLIVADLSEQDFTDQVNRNIFRSVCESFLEGKPVDSVSVMDKLRSGQILNETHLERVMRVCSAEFIPSITHAEVVKRLSRTRSFLQELKRIEGNLRGGINIDSVLQDFSFAVTTATGSAAKMTSAEDAILATIEGIKKQAAGELKLAGVPSGFTDIDNITGGLAKGNLIILAGRPAMGKSTLALNIAENIARNGQQVAFFSLEMTRAELSMKMLSRMHGIPLCDLRSGSLSKSQIEALERDFGYHKKIPLHIIDRPSLSLAQVTADCKSLKLRKGLDFVVVDYLQLMDGNGAATRDLEVGNLTRGLKRLAGELEIPVMVLSQLNRGLEGRKDKRPVLSDLRDSGAIEQDANLVLFIFRDEIYNQKLDSPRRGVAEVNVAKNRMGKTGTVKISSARLEFSEFVRLSSRNI